MSIILHIANQDEWEESRKSGVYKPGSVDSDGFIHCSTIEQTVGTANRFFKGIPGLVLLCIDETRIDAECRYEPPAEGPADGRQSETFPHIYGSLNLDAIRQTVPFPCGEDGTFEMPAEIEKL